MEQKYHYGNVALSCKQSCQMVLLIHRTDTQDLCNSCTSATAIATAAIKPSFFNTHKDICSYIVLQYAFVKNPSRCSAYAKNTIISFTKTRYSLSCCYFMLERVLRLQYTFKWRKVDLFEVKLPTSQKSLEIHISLLIECKQHACMHMI